MNSFKHPLTPLITDPVGIDKPIQDIQTAIATIPWIEKSFGRTWQAYKTVDKKEIVYPETWQGTDKDLLDVMPNDNVNAQSFITVGEPFRIPNYNKRNFNRVTGIINIIVWFNLERLVDTVDYRFTEILKLEVLRTLNEMTFKAEAGITVNQIWEQANNVFAGFTIDRLKQQELVHPFGGFRFECQLTYLEDCPAVSL